MGQIPDGFILLGHIPDGYIIVGVHTRYTLDIILVFHCMYISTLLYYYVNKGSSILFYAINSGKKFAHGNNRAMKQKSKGNFDNKNLQKLYYIVHHFFPLDI